MSSKMDQNLKIVIKTFTALLLLSLSWLTGYLMGQEINPAINNQQNTPVAEKSLTPAGTPDIPPLINLGDGVNGTSNPAKQNLPIPPPIIK